MSKAEQYRALIEFIKSSGAKTLISSDLDMTQFNFGLGKFKELLLPLDDISQWNDTDKKYFALATELNEAINQKYGEDAQEVIDSIKNASLTSYFTPENVVESMVQGVLAIKPKNILEPSTGTGNYLPSLARSFPMASIVAIEKEQLTAEILQERAKVISDRITVINKPLEEDRSTGYDLIISNIPFGDIKIYDSQLYKEANPEKIKASTRIHNYYFVKSLDKLNNGGVISFLVSSALMDNPGNSNVREFLMKNSDLITAYRLPDNVFKSEGTQASTDVIVLRKNIGKKKLTDQEKKFVTQQKIELPNDKGIEMPVNINSYYIGSNQVLGKLVCDGQYGNDTAVAKWESTEEEFLKSLRAMSLLTAASLQGMEEVQRIVASADIAKLAPVGTIELDPAFEIHPTMVHGNLMEYRGKAGLLHIENGNKYLKVYPELKDPLKVKALSDLRNVTKSLLAAEENSAANMDDIREQLNDAYNSFSFTYDTLHRNPNLLSLDADEAMMLSLEKLTEENGKKVYVKSDIFTMRINGVKAELKTSEELSDAMLYSLNAVGKLDLELISSVAGRPVNEIISEGIERKLIYFEVDDTGAVVPVTKDVFYSGNMYEKIARMSADTVEIPIGGQQLKEIYISELEASKPVPIPMELIDINIGERWIDPNDYQKFATHYFETESEVKYRSGTKSYFVRTVGYSSKEAVEMAIYTKSGDTVKGVDILRHALMNTSPEFTYEVADPEDPTKKKRTKDMDAIMAVRHKIEEIQKSFKEFIVNEPEIRERLETQYNFLYNNTTLRRYDGSHLRFEQMEHFKPYQHQKDTIWQICQNNGGIADQKVGSGKTLVMVGSAMEMRRLGIANKPAIVAMKANAAAVARDFKKAYPNAKVLYPRPVDFDVKRRREFLNKIKTNDWDCVVLTHEQFGMIPQSQEIINKILDDEIRGLGMDMKLLEDAGYSRSRKAVLKSLEKKKASLQAKLAGKIDSINKDEQLPSFQELGIDHLLVDESHQFKNLNYTTNFSRVKGLGTPEGSLRSTNMLLACRTLQELHKGEKGITFLSGTPISNSLVEMPLLLKYLSPLTLEKMGIETIDGFLTTFAKKSHDMEFNVAGEIKSTERFREFIKVPEMLTLYRKLANIVTDENFKVDKPLIKTELVMIKPSEEQLEFNQSIINFVNTKDPAYIGRPDMTEGELTAYALIATNLSRKASLDMRLINPDLDFNPESKLARMASNIARIYTETNSFKGTQFMFSDVSTPNEDKFNIYDELKRILIEHHCIPEDKITYIHDHEGDRKKNELFQRVNNGDIRIVMGSTQKMGTGVNMQERNVAIHHADIPWRPSDREQRNGRGVRQGNWAAKEHNDNFVHEFIYATERTLDAYQFDILKNKEHFIKQTKKLNIEEMDRTIRESDMGEDGAISARDITAILSGNNDLMERSKILKKLEAIERNYEYSYSAHSKEVHIARFQSGQNERNITSSSSNIESLKADVKWLEANHVVEKEALKELEENNTTSIWSSKPKETPEQQAEGVKKEKGFEYPMPVVIDGKPLKKTEEVGQALHEEMKRLRWLTKDGAVVDVGTYGNFDIKLRKKEDKTLGLYGGPPFEVLVKSKSTPVTYTFNNGDINENEKLAGLYIHRAITKAPKILDTEMKHINECYQARESLRKKMEKVFENPDKEKIQELKEQLRKLDLKMSGASDKSEVKEVIIGVNDELPVATRTAAFVTAAVELER
jgi:N12 class adenine-specific DNA methylase